MSMTKMTGKRPAGQTVATADPGPPWIGSADGSPPSEQQVHDEHRAALEATLFRSSGEPDEVVLVLESGLLRLHATDR